MPDTNPACRTAFRSNSEIVRHPVGTLSGITPECCPPSVRNRVRHGAERARDGKVKSTRITGKNFFNVKKAFKNHLDTSANLMTDEHKKFRKIGKKFASHQTVNHGRKE